MIDIAGKLVDPAHIIAAAALAKAGVLKR